MSNAIDRDSTRFHKKPMKVMNGKQKKKMKKILFQTVERQFHRALVIQHQKVLLKSHRNFRKK